MKKLLIVGLALLGMIGSAGAACVGPYCWDDRGAAISGLPWATPMQDTKANLNSQAPKATKQLVYCTDCSNFWGNTIGGLCISSGTGIGAYVQMSTNSAVGNCN